MRKSILSIIFIILTFICLATAAALCNWCGYQTAENIEETDIEIEDEAVEETKKEPIETVEEAVEEEEAEGEEISEEEKETEDGIPPTIELEIYEGPVYSSADNVCYYRVQANVTGTPAPDVGFSKDDSGGAWGKYRVQVNLSGIDDSYKLTATATNSEGNDTDTIELFWECEIEEVFEISDINKNDIKKVIEGVDIGQIIPAHIVLHPSDIGYVVYPSGVNTTTCFIGDSLSNTNVKGYFAFDVSSLIGKDITAATLYMEGTIIGDPTFKGTITLRWGTYLPLNADDYLMLGLVRPVDTFDNNENPIIFSREDLVIAIENCAIFNEKLQFGITYFYDTTDWDNLLDGREYNTEDISLIVYYEN